MSIKYRLMIMHLNVWLPGVDGDVRLIMQSEDKMRLLCFVFSIFRPMAMCFDIVGEDLFQNKEGDVLKIERIEV